MNKRVEVLTVRENIKLNHDTNLLYFQSDSGFETIRPGQFVNILVTDSPSTFLRRPFSFFDVDYTNNTFSVLVKVVGDGTRKITSAKVGDRMDIMYPLGNGFTLPNTNDRVLLVGGGVGIAPMMQLAHEAAKIGAEVHILLGARSESDHVKLEDFSKYGQLYITTNDGSAGVHGFVTDHQVWHQERKFDMVYCCGPDPMMHAVAKKAKLIDTQCEVSLENTMACGFGVCLCCVTKTTQGHKCVCTDGPVFNTNDLQWQI